MAQRESRRTPRRAQRESRRSSAADAGRVAARLARSTTPLGGRDSERPACPAWCRCWRERARHVFCKPFAHIKEVGSANTHTFTGDETHRTTGDKPVGSVCLSRDTRGVCGFTR